MTTQNFEVKTEVGKDSQGNPIYKTGSASFVQLDTVDELIDVLQSDPEQAKKILADVNRQRKTDAGNQARSALKAKDSNAAIKKTFVAEFENMLTAKGLKLTDLVGRSAEDIATLLKKD